MGQHKHNPTAIAAKNGKLPPKKKSLSKRETECDGLMLHDYSETVKYK